MRLKIIEVNFTNAKSWLFKLTKEDGAEVYIMDSRFYKERNLKSPITKKELDYLDKGQWISASVELIDNLLVVVEIS